jgi:uncharacterized membrane protein
MLFFSLTFGMFLLAIRIYVSESLMYVFYAWNLFLAAIPLLLSRSLLYQRRISFKAGLMLFGWLLFFPNAPYIITDIFHFKERSPIPTWFDLLLVTSAAWNGLILGLVSLMNIETFLIRHFLLKQVRLFVIISLAAGSFGIYLGRFLRFNSWNVITHPEVIIKAIGMRVIHPFEHTRTWGFTVLFAVFISLIYYTLKQLPALHLKQRS